MKANIYVKSHEQSEPKNLNFGILVIKRIEDPVWSESTQIHTILLFLWPDCTFL